MIYTIFTTKKSNSNNNNNEKEQSMKYISPKKMLEMSTSFSYTQATPLLTIFVELISSVGVRKAAPCPTGAAASNPSVEFVGNLKI